MDTLVDEVTRRLQTNELPQCYLEAFSSKKTEEAPCSQQTSQPLGLLM